MYNFGEIDLTRDASKIKIFLAKPNSTIIAKLTEAYDVNNKLSLGSINSLSFKVPYEVDIRHNIKPNQHVNMLKFRYLLKVVLNDNVEWYMITDIEDIADDNGDSKEVKAMSLGYELKDKLIRNYSTEESGPKTCTEVLTDALSQTLWTVDYVDASFDAVMRSFSVTSKTALDFVNEIAETFKGVIQWDTENRTISIYKEENIGTNKGLVFSYDKYIKSINKDTVTDEMTTRLKVYGKDDLSINRLNPTGTNYLEDFSYFLYPFERDGSNNVLNHSDYMSDELCNAILDYNELLETKQGDFAGLVTQKETKQTEYDAQEIVVSTKEIEKKAIEDIVDVQQSYGTYNSVSLTHTASTTSNITLSGGVGGRKHVVMMKVDNVSGLTINYAGTPKTLSSGVWAVVAKENIVSNTQKTITISGATTTSVKIISCEISSTEYSTSGNESTLINKYNLDNKQTQLNTEQATLNTIQSQMDAIDDQIETLRDEIKVENNFTVGQLEERNMFIIEKEWIDQNYTDDQSLYDDAVKKFEKLREPQTIINIDVVNFLEVIECQRDWNKLNLGDIVTIKYDKFNVNVRAKIIEIDFNHESGEIELTIANVKDIKNDKERFLDLLYKSISTSTTVDMNRLKWDKTIVDLGVVGQIIDNAWDATKREINAGVSESVNIGPRGITVFDPNDPNRFIRLTHSAIGLSVDGGNTYSAALNPDGILGEMVIGKLILGNKLTIGDSQGIFNAIGPKLSIIDRNDNDVMKFGLYEGTTPETEKFGVVLQKYNTSNVATHKVIMDRDDGFKIQKKVGASWEDVVWLNESGQLNLKDIIAVGTISTPQLTVANIDVNDLIYDAVEGLRAQTTWIKDGMIEANTISASKIKTSELIVGTNIAMGPSATISWGNVTSKPSFVSMSDINWDNVKSTVITAGGITTPYLAATAIDGMTITGATVRTAASGSRVLMDSSGLKLYDSGGAVVVNLNTSTGSATFKGDISSGSTITGSAINGSTISGTDISGGTVTGSTVRTASSGARIELLSGFADIKAYNPDGTVVFRGYDTGDGSYQIWNPYYDTGLGGLNIGSETQGKVIGRGTWQFYGSVTFSGTVNGVTAKFG